MLGLIPTSPCAALFLLMFAVGGGAANWAGAVGDEVAW